MGVGYPLDIVVCVCLGADMFDCVYPTRTARFGTALVPHGLLKLKHKEFARDFRPIDEECDCPVCRSYTRATLHALATREIAGAQLISQHNIAYLLRLTKAMRQAILADDLPRFVNDYMAKMFPKGDVPKWVRDALKVAGIELQF